MRTISEELLSLKSAGLERKLKRIESPPGTKIAFNGCDLWNFSANDYLGLSNHKKIKNAYLEGIEKYGLGATASRLISGSSAAHHLLEEEIARHKKSASALYFSTGYAAALGTIPSLVSKGDFVILDKLSHASLIDAAKLSGATLRVFPHNNLEKLEKILSTIRATNSQARLLVVTESVFSMDGDLCPLAEIVNLKNRHGAMLLLDEAHGLGTLGSTGMGLAEELNLQHDIELQMGTLSKSAGLAGGFIACSEEIRSLLIHRARSFIYSTAPPPALAHAAITALNIIASEEGDSLRAKLKHNIQLLCQGLGLAPSPSPIIPLIIGENHAALHAAHTLLENGFLIPAIRYPTVPKHTARLRISLSAAHSPATITALMAQINQLNLANSPAVK